MLFCLTANYTPQALNAMREKPASRRAAAEQLLTAAGGKLVEFYFTIAEGPGAHVILDADGDTAAAMTSTAVASGAFQNVRMIRLFSEDEATAVREKRAKIQATYKAPGQWINDRRAIRCRVIHANPTEQKTHKQGANLDWTR